MSIELIKQIREETGIGLAEIKKALEDAGGDLVKAKEILRKSGSLKAQKRAGRKANQGVIEVYSHAGKLGVLVEVNCETDFVAKNNEFKDFAHNIALQIAAMRPADIKELLEQEYIKDQSKKIQELLDEIISKTGEKVEIKRFCLFELGIE